MHDICTAIVTATSNAWIRIQCELYHFGISLAFLINWLIASADAFLFDRVEDTPSASYATVNWEADGHSAAEKKPLRPTLMQKLRAAGLLAPVAHNMVEEEDPFSDAWEFSDDGDDGDSDEEVAAHLIVRGRSMTRKHGVSLSRKKSMRESFKSYDPAVYSKNLRRFPCAMGWKKLRLHTISERAMY